jgi:murein DD-endopeptidase MepM/ murein hydrolase activator NlpD
MGLNGGRIGPVNGYRPRSSRGGSNNLIILGVVAAVVASGFFGWWLGRTPAAPSEDSEAVTPEVASTPAIDLSAVVINELPALETETPLGPDVPKDHPRALVGRIESSIYSAFASQFDAEDKEAQLVGQQIAAHFKRIFVFDIDFTRDVRPGDQFAVLWKATEESSDGIRILAASFYSKLLGKRFEAYYFKDASDNFARHYTSEGLEAQRRLKQSPIQDFEQVTSLLNDRRPKHEGIDFKAPVGTAVTSPFDAVVIESQYKIARFNGRFVKLLYPGKNMEAIFLHLDSLTPGLTPGKRIKAGTEVGKVGNTGRSFAPHLHYQLQRSKGRVLNPYDVHGSTRREVSAGSRADFEGIMKQYRSLLPALNESDRAPDETAVR